MNENKIGLVQLKKGTSDNNWRKIEEFFIANGLFISSVPKGIMVTDTDKAKKLIESFKEQQIREMYECSQCGKINVIRKRINMNKEYWTEKRKALCEVFWDHCAQEELYCKKRDGTPCDMVLEADQEE